MPWKKVPGDVLHSYKGDFLLLVLKLSLRKPFTGAKHNRIIDNLGILIQPLSIQDGGLVCSTYHVQWEQTGEPRPTFSSSYPRKTRWSIWKSSPTWQSASFQGWVNLHGLRLWAVCRNQANWVMTRAHSQPMGFSDWMLLVLSVGPQPLGWSHWGSNPHTPAPGTWSNQAQI